MGKLVKEAEILMHRFNERLKPGGIGYTGRRLQIYSQRESRLPNFSG